LRFMLGNLHDFTPSEHSVSTDQLPELDRYMLVKLNQLTNKVKKAYNEYEFLTVHNAIHNYCTVELSSFYFDYAKDILYTNAADDPKRRGIQTVIYKTLVSLTKLLTPIIPHTTDEAWQFIPEASEESVQ